MQKATFCHDFMLYTKLTLKHSTYFFFYNVNIDLVRLEGPKWNSCAMPKIASSRALAIPLLLSYRKQLPMRSLVFRTRK